MEWFFGDNYDEELGRYKKSVTVSRLSGAYQDLARAAAELYTNRRYEFDLTRVTSWDIEVFRIFTQALEVRRGRG